MIRPQLILDVQDELIVDNFAGGGGASTGIEMALGRHVDIAINHDPMAVALHSANHPQTHHLCEDVFTVDPVAVTNGRPVGFAWFSPDCKHFSKAKGGKPRSKKIRGLAWVAVKWGALKRPRVFILENVEEFQTWGPLLSNGDPDPAQKGRTFDAFIACLTTGIAPNHPDLPEIIEFLGKDFPIHKLIYGLGYDVEYRELRACDYGAPTIRKRFFLIARCDGRPIVWPKQTHADPHAKGFRASGLLPWRTAAECIDWSLPCPSIFLTKEEARVLGVKRPLVVATERRLAKGIRKFVLEANEPFIVQYHSAKRAGDDRVSPVTTPIGTQTTENRFGLAFPYVVPLTHQGGDRVESIAEPFRTLTGAHRGEKALAVPYVVNTANSKTTGRGPNVWSPHEPLRTITSAPGFAAAVPFLTEHANASNQRTFPADEPLRTQCAEVKGGHFALVSAFLAKHYGGVTGSKVSNPIGTVTSVDHHSLVASHLTKFYGTTTGQATNTPLHSVTANGQHIGEVRAFLMKYYGEGGQDQDIHDPLHTVPTKDRFGLVTVEGTLYQISDIGMRMLIPRELYRAQGFPESFIINITVEVVRNRKVKRVPLSSEAQVRMCGNSVCPPQAAALVAANVPEMAIWSNRERKALRRYTPMSAVVATR